MSYFKFRIPTFILRPFRTASRLYLDSKAGQDETDFEYIPDVISFERIIADKSSPVMTMKNFFESQAHFCDLASHFSRISGLSSLRPTGS